jgi:lipoic acid synthetase
VLTPDFLRKEGAVATVVAARPDVFNHNLETVRELYPNVRPGADYDWSLQLLARFGAEHPGVPTKSGIMLGLGEDMAQVQGALRDLRAHNVDMITIGQYLQPTAHHHPVIRYWTPAEFKELEVYGLGLGFTHVASGPMVRSSYHADRMAAEAGYVDAVA